LERLSCQAPNRSLSSRPWLHHVAQYQTALSDSISSDRRASSEVSSFQVFGNAESPPPQKRSPLLSHEGIARRFHTLVLGEHAHVFGVLLSAPLSRAAPVDPHLLRTVGPSLPKRSRRPRCTDPVGDLKG